MTFVVSPTAVERSALGADLKEITMKKVLVLILALTWLGSTPAAAQTRRSTAPQAARTQRASPAVRAAAQRIAAQAKSLSNFLFVYGGVIKTIESASQTAREGGMPSTAVARIKENKNAVVESIRNVQAGLNQMETDFRADPTLKLYSQHVNGLSEDVGLAADAAEADRFDDAGKKLVEVIGVLLDALVPPV
jgi:hypothetical protein